MRESELVAAIVLLYDYAPAPTDPKRITCKVGNSIIPTFMLIQPLNDYLKRKGYFSKCSGQPTLKLYKLLHKHNVRIEQLKQEQDEFRETKHVTQYDKFGNKKIL